MSGPLSKAAPPPPTAEKRAQRRKQTRMIWRTLAFLVVAFAAWQGYLYYASASERAETQVQAGLKSLSPGLYENAIEEFGKALDTNPNSWNAYLQRGLAQQGLGKLDEALTDFEQALKINPSLLEALTARAEIYRQKGDTPKSIAELTRVIELKPDVTAHYSRGLAYAEIGQHEPAIADFTWVIDQVRDAPFAYFARARSKRALGDEAGADSDHIAGDSLDRGNVR